MIDTTSVLGYAWPLAAAAGEEIKFHLSSASLPQVNARIVRVRCGDPDPLGPGLRTTPMEADLNGSLDFKFQPIYPGSYALIEDRPIFAAARALSFGCYLFPTIVGERPQTIASRHARYATVVRAPRRPPP